MTERLLRVNEVADRLGTTYRTVYRRIHAGLLKGTLEGSQWRVKESDLDAYIQSLPTTRSA